MKVAKWKQIPLGQCCEVLSGFPFKSDGFTDNEEDVHLVKGENIGQGQVLWDISKRWPRKDSAELEKYRLIAGDVVLAMDRPWVPAGLKFARIPESAPDAWLVQRAARLRANAFMKQPFLACLVGSPDFTAYIQNVGRGVGVPHISSRQICAFSVHLPPLIEQERIADTLTAYDDLMENNRRRMALLEESARLLYREWFVLLRFPGHEHTRLTNGVPQGWERAPLGERVTLNYGKALKADERIEGPFPVYGSSGIVGTHEKALVKGPGIVVGRKGNVGSVFWSGRDFCPIDTVYFIDAETSDLYLYYALKHMHFISTDVAVPGLNRDLAYSRPLLTPPPALRRDFLDFVQPVHDQLDKLAEQTQKLRTARDLLLPRLMSGELAV